jgi:integrase
MDEGRRLLCAARDHAPELVPYLAIAVFAGVRATELQRLTWEHVNFDLHYIHIGGGISRVRNERYVDMEDILIRWLEPCRQASGLIAPQDTYGFNKLYNKARKEAGLRDAWAPDMLRHTYASYHVAKYERKDKTALMMGNSVKMLDRHYRRPLHRSDTKGRQGQPSQGRQGASGSALELALINGLIIGWTVRGLHVSGCGQMTVTRCPANYETFNNGQE